MTIKIQPGKYYRLKGGGVMKDREVLIANAVTHEDFDNYSWNRVGSYWSWQANGMFRGREHVTNFPMHVEREILE